jgi:predicted RNA-binding protein Jag
MKPAKSIPEGAETVGAEGSDLASAIAKAAEAIGVETQRVEFKFDMDHFRSSLGTSVAKKTVKIVAWNTTKSDEELAAEESKKPAPRARRDDDDDRGERKERRSRDRGDRGDRKERRGRDRGDREERRGRDRGDREERREKRTRQPAPPDDELVDTEASTFANEWFTELMGLMDIEGTVKSSGDDERVQLWISAERAGRLIGKRGSTLGAIRHLLGLAVVKAYGELTIDVDVEDNRPRRDDDRGDRKERRSRRDRGDRGGRGGDKRGGGDRSRYPEEKLRALARRAAEKALESDKTITINLELNSYDRRIVHMEVADVDGVDSRSEERDDGVKIIQVFPVGDED